MSLWLVFSKKERVIFIHFRKCMFIGLFLGVPKIFLSETFDIYKLPSAFGALNCPTSKYVLGQTSISAS